MMKARATLLIVALPLAACSVGPHYQRPALDVPSSFRAQEETPTEKSLGDAAWWEVYQDKTLAQVIITARELSSSDETLLKRSALEIIRKGADSGQLVGEVLRAMEQKVP